MKKLIRKILREHKSDKHYKMLDKISDHVQLPYFKSMESLTIYDKDDQEYIMKKILGNISFSRYYIYDDRGNRIYWEGSDGDWSKWEYDDKGNIIYYENSDGWWEKSEYDDKGNMLYSEGSDGIWQKYVYDEDGNEIDYDEGDNR